MMGVTDKYNSTTLAWEYATSSKNTTSAQEDYSMYKYFNHVFLVDLLMLFTAFFEPVGCEWFR